MVDIVAMLSYRKGDGQTYRPEAGTRCLFSGPHMDDENGYVYSEVEILWRDDVFVVTRIRDCWPTIHKWEHVRAKPLAAPETSAVQKLSSTNPCGPNGECPNCGGLPGDHKSGCEDGSEIL